MENIEEAGRIQAHLTAEKVIEAALAGDRAKVKKLVHKSIKEGQIRALKWVRRVSQNQVERELELIEKYMG